MRKSLALLLTGAMLSFPSIKAGVNAIPYKNNLENKTEIFAKNETKNIPDTLIYKKYVEDIKAPRYKLAPENCARYLIKSAKKLFGKEYVSANAWNMQYHNEVISKVNDSSDIINLIKKEKLTPGMAVGFYNSKSKYKNYKDEKRKKVTCTHIALYVGLNKDFKPEFIHQNGKKINKSTITQMYKLGYKPKIILDAIE